MGLSLSNFETPDGTVHETTYWHAQNISVSSPQRFPAVEIQYTGWISREAMEAGKASIGTRSVRLSDEDAQTYFGDQFDALLEKSYRVAKEHDSVDTGETEPVDSKDPSKGTRPIRKPVFDGAADVLEAEVSPAVPLRP